MLEAAYGNAIQYLGTQSDQDMARPLPEGPVMGGLPVSDIVWAMIEHTAHHRGALTVYSHRQLRKVLADAVQWLSAALRVTPLAANGWSAHGAVQSYLRNIH